jgi:hypothetical protein
MIGSAEPRAPSSRRRLWIALTAAFVVLLGLVGGIGWVGWWVLDNVDAPGPAATGSGPCSPADSVNLQFLYTDGHTVQACTRDRPGCPNVAINNGGANGTGPSQFNLSNQLRSSSRRYILLVRFDAALPAETSDQTLQLDPQVAMAGLPGFASGNGALTGAIVQITPRDPASDGYTAATGSLVVSSSHGQAHGRIDGNLSGGASGSPVWVSGTFDCNH